MGFYIKFQDGIPACWQWAWDKMHKNNGQRYKAIDVIRWHDQNKKRENKKTGELEQYCPYCIEFVKEERTNWG